MTLINSLRTCVLASVCLTFWATASSASLIVTPPSQTINLGGDAAVNIDITGLGNGSSPALAAYTGLVISYDSTLLMPISVTFSNRLGDPTDPTQTLLLSNLFLPSAVQLDGVSFLSAAQLFALQSTASNEFTIATLTFQGVADGTSPLDLAYGALSDENGNSLTETIVNGSVTVGGTSMIMPEPASLALLGIGLAAFGFLNLRRK